MAIWQFECSLLPRAELIARFGCIPSDLPAEVADDERWWTQHQPPAGYTSMIETFAPPYKSWSDSILMWGEENGHRVHVVLEGERAVCITCRIDLRAFSHPFARGVLRLADFCGCMLWASPSRLFEPQWEQ